MTPPSDQRETLFEFGSFRLDSVQRLLTRGGDLVPLEPKVFDTLHALVEARGRLLSKDELLERVWPGTFVEEGSLARNVSTLRRVLGDSLDAGGGYIETIPKRGYRLRAAVRPVASESPSTGSKLANLRPGGQDSRASVPSWLPALRPTGVWLVACLILVTGGGGLFVWSAVSSPATAVSASRSIAVLPIQNLSGDPDQEFVADGTTEELIATLSQVRSLRVIGHTSVARYKGTTKSAAEIGRELGVDAVLEGAVRRFDNRVRVTTQLVDAVTNATVWSKSYEADSPDLLMFQLDVGRAVASAVRAQISPTESARLAKPRAINPMAYAEILKGQTLRFRGSDENYRQSIAHYTRAIELEPDGALAYAGMALSWGLLSGSSGIEPARDAAARAIALDPELPEAHAAMAEAFYRSYDFEEGHAESERALQLSPGSLDGCYCYAFVLAATGRDRDALRVASLGVARNPMASAAHHARGVALYFARQFEAAIPSFTRAAELDPKSRVSPLWLSRAYSALGRGDKAVAILEAAGLGQTHHMVVAYARAGRRAEAVQLVQKLASANPPVVSMFLAQAYAALDDREAALGWLTRSIEARETVAFWVIDETFDNLRSDPRFAALVKQVKMPPSYYAFLRTRGLASGES